MKDSEGQVPAHQADGFWNLPRFVTSFALIGLTLAVLVSILVGLIFLRGLRADNEELRASSLLLKLDVDTLRSQVEKLQADLESVKLRIQLQGLTGVVDLTETSLQSVGEGFSVGRLEVTKHLSGVKITGIILNASSVDHSQLRMKVTVLGKEKEFNVTKVRSGRAAKFSVYVPDVKAEEAQLAKLEYVRSTVGYFVE